MLSRFGVQANAAPIDIKNSPTWEVPNSPHVRKNFASSRPETIVDLAAKIAFYERLLLHIEKLARMENSDTRLLLAIIASEAAERVQQPDHSYTGGYQDTY